jgi:hypothetical protein
VIVDTFLTNRLNLGSKDLAAGPPSDPNSLALHRQSISAFRSAKHLDQDMIIGVPLFHKRMHIDFFEVKII